MQVDQVMSEYPVTVSPTTPCGDVVDLMYQHDIRHVPVVEDGRVVGMVSDRDLRNLIDPRDIETASIDGVISLRRRPTSEVMTTQVASVQPKNPLSLAATTMVDRQVGAVPVIDPGTEKLVGIISFTDILEQYAYEVERGGDDDQATVQERYVTDAGQLVRKIVCTTDFSTAATRAVDYALGLGRQLRAEIHLLHVYSVPSVPSVVGGAHTPETLVAQLRAWANDKMGSELQMWNDRQVKIVPHIEGGAAADTIVAKAEELEADLIVIGTHGRGGVSRLLIGSVADRVVRTANRPVLTVRTG